ncbi:ring finger protein [Dorcoceras hygrometricum]|uniref:RING-type E3 ubiquitin transferase n=1 Tax=Dorcoceras hygrometricum TaxID=472368 RepID=A0A2Z7CZM8_9LAMI|nr:ring finger protein [Dorcoceras hygrometricum]
MGIGDDNSGGHSFFNDKDRNKYDANSRIMISAIISLSFVVLLVTLLHLYARCVIRRQARRREALHRLGFLRTSAIVHTEPPRTGLDPSVIASLPVLVFKQTDRGNSFECSVCLSALEDGERARLLPNCKHTFHIDCIDKWLGSNSTCPICRAEAEPSLVPEPREGMLVAAGDAPTSAPPFEGTSEGSGAQSLAKVTSVSSSRLNSFRRILSRERSSPRIQNHQSCGQDEGYPDLERQ